MSSCCSASVEMSVCKCKCRSVTVQGIFPEEPFAMLSGKKRKCAKRKIMSKEEKGLKKRIEQLLGSRVYVCSRDCSRQADCTASCAAASFAANRLSLSRSSRRCVQCLVTNLGSLCVQYNQCLHFINRHQGQNALSERCFPWIFKMQRQ